MLPALFVGAVHARKDRTEFAERIQHRPLGVDVRTPCTHRPRPHRLTGTADGDGPHARDVLLNRGVQERDRPIVLLFEVRRKQPHPRIAGRGQVDHGQRSLHVPRHQEGIPFGDLEETVKNRFLDAAPRAHPFDISYASRGSSRCRTCAP